MWRVVSTTLAIFLALGFQAGNSAEPEAPSSETSATGVPASKTSEAEGTVSEKPTADAIATRQTLFAIPFTVDRPTHPSEEPGKVQLHVSTDQGATWRLYATVEPSRRQFLFRAGGDAQYWFQVRTLDRSARVRPQPPNAQTLRVVVDTTRPAMELSARRGQAGEVTARWKINEPHPNPRSLTIHYRTANNPSWQPVAVGEEKRKVSGTIETNEVTFWPGAAGEIQIRAEVSDLAGNRAISHAQVKTGQTAGKQPTQKPQQSGSAWQPGTNQTATPWPAKDVTSAKEIPAKEILAKEIPAKEIPAKEHFPTHMKKRKLVSTVEQLKADPTIGPVAGKVNPPIQRQYVPSSPAASRPAADLTPGERPRMINKRLFELEYNNDVAGQGTSRIELWGTRDGGRTWHSYPADDDSRSPMWVSVDEEGIYGFRIVRSNGPPANPPKPGTPPEIFIGVDMTKPTGRITSAENAGGSEGKLIVTWEAADRFLGPRPVSLLFSKRPGGPWNPLASGLENTGRYEWVVDGRVPESIYLRLEVRDEAGNVAIYEKPEPVILQRGHATLRIRGVRTLGQDYRNAARQHPLR